MGLFKALLGLSIVALLVTSSIAIANSSPPIFSEQDRQCYQALHSFSRTYSRVEYLQLSNRLNEQSVFIQTYRQAPKNVVFYHCHFERHRTAWKTPGHKACLHQLNLLTQNAKDIGKNQYSYNRTKNLLEPMSRGWRYYLYYRKRTNLSNQKTQLQSQFAILNLLEKLYVKKSYQSCYLFFK